MHSNLEEIAKRFFMSKGYLVAENVLFFLPAERERKKVSGWSDIDILAYKKSEIVIVQCKEFLGTEESERVVNKILNWFEKAEEFIKNEKPYKDLVTEDTQIKKCVVLNFPQPKKAVKRLKKPGIEVIDMETIVKELISSVKEKIEKYEKRRTGARGKEIDLIRYFIKILLERSFLRSEKLSYRP